MQLDGETMKSRLEAAGGEPVKFRFRCWLLGHAWDAGHAHGWSGYVTHQCRRCQHVTFTQFNF